MSGGRIEKKVCKGWFKSMPLNQSSSHGLFLKNKKFFQYVKANALDGICILSFIIFDAFFLWEL